MNNICIIPARGGSKRIPRKNIKEFMGKPIIAYSIEVAIKTGLFDKIVVSTDDLEIAEISKKYGAEIPFMRSNENSSDFATTAEVIVEVMDNYKLRGINFQFVCCLYPTAPLVSSDKLIEGFQLIKNKDAGSVFPIVSFDFPIWRSLTLGEDKIVKMNWPEFQLTRTQDLPPAYHDAGQWYWLNNSYIQKNHGFYFDNSIGLVLDKYLVQDIDNESDWEMALLKFSKQNS